MGKIVSGITDAIGLTNTKGEKKAAAAASRANDQAYAMSKEQIELAKEQLDFQKQQYADWNNIYGDIQTNLGNYYNSLDPNKLVALGLENQQREFQQVDAAIKRDFAQRGMTNSGQELATTAQNQMGNAQARAVIRTNADTMANEEKLKFLGLGLGQGTQMLGIIGNAAANVTGAYSSGINSRTNIANSYLGRATQLGTAGMNAMGDVIGSVTGSYLGGK